MPRYVTMAASQGGWWLRFDYDPEVVADLKSIPGYARKWNPEMKAWWIHAEWLDAAKRVIERRTHVGERVGWCFTDPEEEDVSDYDTFDDFKEGKKRPPPPKQDPPPSCFAKLYVVPTAPPEVIKAAYGALAKLHHPDTTTDPTQKEQRHRRMTEINAAYEEADRIAKARR